ncbi:MAG: outer membrane lipoprotein chaperone LolA [Gammaproteobacteria bacterium]|nr:outer membrane lipoprotein chaperone LolA [Gammaproteobacteria bacterium]
MPVRLLAALVTVLALFAARSLAAAPVDGLVAYLNGLDSFVASFTQQRFDEDGELLETAHGDCAIARPGRFRWNYTDPYEQVIVSDGVTLWIYDADLEQVTESVLGEAGAGSPAALLGRETDVAAHYAITPLEPRDGLDWFRLEARDIASDFTAIELGWGEGEVRAMRLTDNLGQVTTLAFADIVRNGAVDLAQFNFEPPPGVDVVRGGMP